MTTRSDRGFAREYADAILWRGRVPMQPATFTPDWSDRPRKWKHYPDTDVLPLPDGQPGTVRAGLAVGDAPAVPDGSAERAAPGRAGFALPDLGGMLRDTYGLVGRRLAIQANTDLAALPSYGKANWHRGAASGGGLYPVTVSLVAGPGAPVLPGVYHYDPGRHALRRLLAGDLTPELRAALGGSRHGGFLVLGVKYWQNAFKYNSFCFHAVSMDVGAAAQAMRGWARSAGLTFEPEWFFDEVRLAGLLGVDDSEGLFAVVPLCWRPGATTGSAGHDAPPGTAPPGTALPADPAALTTRVRHRDVERSRRVLTFPMVERMQRATRQDVPGRPAAASLAAAAVAPPPSDRSTTRAVALPPPTPVAGSMRTALRSRRSSFGRFDARRALAPETLATALAAAVAAAFDTLGSRDLMGLYVYVNHVHGVPPGTYRYADGELWLRDPKPPGRFLQDSYFLANYNLERAGAVVVPTMRTRVVLREVGDRGYRLVNAAVGAVAQNVYLASAALGTGCGVALGFDNVAYVEQLGLTAAEVPLLLMMLGTDRPGSADFRYEIA